ncbi:hypothetical protein GGX14DRAFT_595114 [Mycena pura]|uniref:Uncharacterized protein n=1 Tax=Mycena pura TaxID=153505 RepID=A0AAD6VPT1_9AGAR|nr:hypothetical protein GGX14DRAFT_595114 [Mycena pura]
MPSHAQVPAPSNKFIPSAQDAGPRSGLSTERTALELAPGPFTLDLTARGTKTLILPSGRTLTLATNQAPLIPVRAVHRSRYGDDDQYGASPPAVATRTIQLAEEELAGPCQCRGEAPREDPNAEYVPLLRDCCGGHGGTRARLTSVFDGKPRAKLTRSRACAITGAAPATAAAPPGLGIEHHPATPRTRTHRPTSAPRYVYVPSPADDALLDSDVDDDTMPEMREALRINASFWAAGYCYERVEEGV